MRKITTYIIKVNNWEKWNPNKKTSDWFKFSHVFFEDAAIKKLTGTEKLTYVLLLTQASIRRSAEYPLVGSTITAAVPHKGCRVETTLSKLAESGLIEIQIEGKGREEKGYTTENKKVFSDRQQKIKKPRFQHPENEAEFAALFADKIDDWLKLYPDSDWIQREITKAYQYFYVEKSKRPSTSNAGWAKRMKSWLERGWNTKSRPHQASNSAHQTDLADEFVNLAVQTFLTEPKRAYEILGKEKYNLAKKIGIDPYGLLSGAQDPKYQKKQWIEAARVALKEESKWK